MEQFFTRDKANEGKKLSLVLPDGKPSDEWIVIRSLDSDAYQKASLKRQRLALKTAESDLTDEELDALSMQAGLDVLVSLVADWSFDDPCNEENVRKLLINAPQIKDAIDVAAHKRAFFYAPSSNSSALSLSKSES
jgi:hypothetical protein